MGKNLDKIICDNCNNFYVHPSGCTETCHAIRKTATNATWGLSPGYFEERLNGDKQSCKEFDRITKRR